jgi:hypothetical protein
LAALTSAAPGGVFAANAVYNYWLSATETNWLALAFAGSLQAFPGLPEHLKDLVGLPVSCRKWAGSGSDALPLAPQISESGWLAASLTRARTY